MMPARYSRLMTEAPLRPFHRKPQHWDRRGQNEAEQASASVDIRKQPMTAAMISFKAMTSAIL